MSILCRIFGHKYGLRVFITHRLDGYDVVWAEELPVLRRNIEQVNRVFSQCRRCDAPTETPYTACPGCKGRMYRACVLGSLVCGQCGGRGIIDTRQDQDSVAQIRRAMEAKP